jgi:peptide/nickel transport system substrate-binding protein
VRFDRVIVYNGETADVAPLVASGDIDYATHGFTPAQEQSFVSAGYDILRPPNYNGPAILFNLDKLEEFQDKRARQAIAHAIDRAANGTIAMGQSGVGLNFMAGFSDQQVPQWISEEDQAELNPYEFDQAKATSLLEDAGWELRDGVWYKPDGDRASYALQYQSNFADYSAAGDDAATQLNDFGFDIAPQGVINTDHDVAVDQSDFELAIHAWGSSAHPHPHFSFVQDLFTHNIPVAANQGGRGIRARQRRDRCSRHGERGGPGKSVWLRPRY